jgi:TRAP transporter TAXI family solute receptor
MKSRFVYPLTVFLVIFSLFVTTQLQAADEIKIPKEITVSGPPVTSSPSILLLAVAPEFEKILGIKINIVPTDLLASQCLLAKIGKADVWTVHMGSGYRALYGVEEYAVEKWGPQRIRIAWKGAQNNLSMMAREKSDIKTMADLKGKKVGVYAGGEGYISACLAFADLTLDDVIVVPATGYSGALKLLLENKVDSAFLGVSSAGTFEIAASPGGLRVLPLPHDDKEGWKRVQKVYPALSRSTPPNGIGVEEGQGIEMLGFPRALFAYDFADEGATYAIAKVFAEGFEAYKDKHTELPFNTLENALDCLELPAPYHAGAIKYFKERGVWTEEHEKWQQNQLRLEDARQVAWKEALSEAKSKGIKVDKDNKQWVDLWMSYLKAIE